MSVPVFILAGQSNAARLSHEIEDSLEAEFGRGNFELLRVYDAGAPLTRTRPDKDDWSDPDELREELTVKTVNALLADDDRVLGGLLWIQGEGDSYNEADAELYAEELDEMLDGFRDDLNNVFGDIDVGVAQAPVTILELSEHAPAAPDREAWEIVVDEQRQVAAEDPLVQTLDPDAVAQEQNVDAAAMFSDGLHYSDDFSRVLADELVQTLVSASHDEGSAETPEQPEGPDVQEAPPVEEAPAREEPRDVPEAELAAQDAPAPMLPMVEMPEPDIEESEAEPEDIGDFAGFESIFWVLPILGLLAGLG